MAVRILLNFIILKNKQMKDSTLGITHQDRRLLDIALEKGKSLVICLNKIDLLRDTFANPKKKKEWLEDLKFKIPCS